MDDTGELARLVESGTCDVSFARLYPGEPIGRIRSRYTGAIRTFESLFSACGAIVVSAPGRIEIGGNHTDHQRGCVLAAAVDLDIIGVAAPAPEPIIRVHSEGHAPVEVALGDLTPQSVTDSSALVRGVSEWFALHGYPVGGFNAYMTSRVPPGSGLSSSAAFEVAVGQILNILYCGGRVSPAELAMAGQYAENIHKGKPCGLMDQMASATGGTVFIDFASPSRPLVKSIAFDVAAAGLCLCVVNTGGSHSDLTGRYASITLEMGQVAALMGEDGLRDVDEAVFRARLPALRPAVGDRALLRSMHFFDENRRVLQMSAALEKRDTTLFLELIRRSGDSSWRLLQNVVSGGDARSQALALALAVSEAALGAAGAWRVHGGGFAGTVLALVPKDKLSGYIAHMSEIFGGDACSRLAVLPAGVTRVIAEGSYGGIAL